MSAPVSTLSSPTASIPRLGQPSESTLHDIRWGDDFEGRFVWVLLISGAAPPAHFTAAGKAHTGTASRPCISPTEVPPFTESPKKAKSSGRASTSKNESLHMDIGRGAAVDLPEEETRRRLEGTTPQWPIMHAVTYGVSRDQMMAKHQANHIQVAYARDAKSADACIQAKAACAQALGIRVKICGTMKA